MAQVEETQQVGYAGAVGDFGGAHEEAQGHHSRPVVRRGLHA